jgi:hypothetical protein
MTVAIERPGACREVAEKMKVAGRIAKERIVYSQKIT